MNEQEEIARTRGRIVSNFALLERLMSAFTAACYFKPDESEQLSAMISEVFEDEYMSFGLKRNIFYRVLKDRFNDRYKSFPKKELERMRQIRNIAAHGLLTAKGKVGSDEIFDITIEHGGKKYEQNLFDEYDSLKEIVEPVVMNLPGLSAKKFFD